MSSINKLAVIGWLPIALLATLGQPTVVAGAAISPTSASGYFAVSTAAGAETIAAIPSDALSLVDDTQTINVSVPGTWTQTNTAPQIREDGSVLPSIFASTDLARLLAGDFSVPGMLYVALPVAADTQVVLAQIAPYGCADAGVQLYDDGAFVGHMQTFTNCGGMPTRIVNIAATLQDNAFTAALTIQLADADNTPFEIVRASFNAYSPTPTDTVVQASQPGGDDALNPSGVPAALIGEFHRSKTDDVDGDADDTDFTYQTRVLIINSDGSYEYRIGGSFSADYYESGTVIATEQPPADPRVQTGTIEFRVDEQVDPRWTLSGRGIARWTIGPDPNLLDISGLPSDSEGIPIALVIEFSNGSEWFSPCEQANSCSAGVPSPEAPAHWHSVQDKVLRDRVIASGPTGWEHG